MALGMNRRRIFVKGLGALQVAELDPTPDASFRSCGFLRDLTLNDAAQQTEIIADTGHLVDMPTQSRKVTAVANLLQSSKEEFDLVRTADGKLHAVRYFGFAGGKTFQWWCFPRVRIAPSLNVEFKPGERIIPMGFAALRDVELDFTVPEYILAETDGDMFLDGLALWTSPRLALNKGTDRILDASGFSRHGVISSDYAAIWKTTTTPYNLEFDGINDTVNFGNVCNIPSNNLAVIEAWIKVIEDGTTIPLISKKQSTGGAGAGYSLYRDSSNRIKFVLVDGTNNIVADGDIVTASVGWVYITVIIDGLTISIYHNGVLFDQFVFSLGSIANSNNLRYAATDSGQYGKAILGDVRIHLFTGSTLPAAAFDIPSKHFAAERAYYGV
jgi:hypothetical protein